jgi:hypothetical protein
VGVRRESTLGKFVTARRAPLLACILVLAVAGCGGGGGDGPAAGASVGAGAPPAIPPPASPPPPPPPSASSASSTALRPSVFLETDPDGAAYLRVQEQAYDPFVPSGAQRVIADRAMGPAPGVNFVVDGDQTTAITDVQAVAMKYGLTMQASSTVSIYNYTYNQFDGGGSIYGAAIKLGDNGRPTNGPTYIQRVAANGMQAPDPTYAQRNNDFIGVEVNSDPIYVRDVTGKNFGDAGVDTKSTHVYIMNATLQSGHRMLRAWPNVEITLVNSIINATPGQSQGWLGGPGATVKYYNTLWCVGSDNPSPSDPRCSMSPTVVEGEDMDAATALSGFVPLASNPLPGVSAFFKSDIDQIAVEYSTDGKTWTPMAIPNAGGPASAPIGDPRYRIPFDLSKADYQFRATFMKNGVKIGTTSQVIDKAGQAVK